MATALKTYDYAVRDRKGQLVNGRLEAANQAALVERLRGMGYIPVRVREANTGLNREIKLPFGRNVSLKDLAVMSRQLATMMNSGLPLLRSLTILSAQTQNKVLAAVLAEVRGGVESGKSLSNAMAEHPRVLPPLMVNMIRAGEVGGFLDRVLHQIAVNYEAEVKLRSKIKSAMTYPAVVFVLAMLSVVGMLLFIVPIFAKMFKDMGGTLPAPTQFLVTMSESLRFSAPALVVLGFAAPMVWRRYGRDDRVRQVLDPLKLRVPVFGSLFRKVAISRFARNLGMMLQSGVPILQSLEIVGETSGNVVFREAARAIQNSVRQGGSMAEPLNHLTTFPPMVVQMIAVGEETGAVDGMLAKVSEFYDQDVDATADALTSLIEPLMIAVLGTVIGGMIIALYLPIFSVFNLIH